MNFDRTKPCKTCPFRTDGNGLRYLGEARAQEIVDSVLSDKSFTCHDDIDQSEQDKSHCAGVLIMLEAQRKPNQLMRIAERLGLYHRTLLSSSVLVFDSFEEWVSSQKEL